LGIAQLESKQCLLVKKDCDVEIDFWGFFKPELFYGQNFTLLNNNNPNDKSFYFRHTNDFFLDLNYGRETYGYSVIQFKSSVRNRAIWGSPTSIAKTLPRRAPFLDAVTEEHEHEFPRLFFWMREAWLKVELGEFLRLGFENNHWFTVGAFPFELGRGIALGSAYAVGPGPLGFYSDAMIDQFAFGLKLSGEFVADVLSYDIYGAILQSKSFSLAETSKPVLKNEIGRRDNPARGFGKDNYVVAARLIWNAFKNDTWGLLTFEPYVMFNQDPEQRVEFFADSSSKLGTYGLAGEYVGKRLEFGFDAAVNMGHQAVFAWDRNQTRVENFQGQVVVVNDNVLMDSTDTTINGKKALHVPKSNAQKVINQSAATASGQKGNADQNGQLIPGGNLPGGLGFITSPLQLQNSEKRFRDRYRNTYHGYMVVGDAAYWIYPTEFQVAITAGIASGDRDPNDEVKDGTYDGFIGLQEVYAGKRVKSVFLLGTVGKVKRPGTAPENPLAAHDFATSTSGFTNLILFGSGCTWKPAWCTTRLVINPNIFAYWEDVPGPKFDPFTAKDLPTQSSPFLGIELNTFISYYPIDSLKCFAIGSVFFPGAHFRDIKGKPLDDAQKRLLERLDRKGLNANLIPNIGDNIAYTINFGMEFAF